MTKPNHQSVLIQPWQNQKQVEEAGFHFHIFGSGRASFDQGSLALEVEADTSQSYCCARIHEVDVYKPVAERVKYWQVTDQQYLQVNYRLKWYAAEVNPSLTESAYMTNAAPFDVDPLAAMTAVGVARTPLLQTYGAVVAQNVVANPQTQALSGFMQVMPLQVDPTKWHDVRLTIQPLRAMVEISQGDAPFTAVIDCEVPEPFEALGFAFSLDNELLPGQMAPVPTKDGLTIAKYEAKLVPAE